MQPQHKSSLSLFLFLILTSTMGLFSFIKNQFLSIFYPRSHQPRSWTCCNHVGLAVVLDCHCLRCVGPRHLRTPVDVIARIRTSLDGVSVDFALDGVSVSDAEDLAEFYHKYISARIEGVRGGDKCTIIMYGPAGSGKSYTMFGCARQQGIVYRALRDILGSGVFVQMGALEIVNEEIYDLLRKRGTPKVRLEVMGKKAKNATYISGNEAWKLSKEVARVDKQRTVKSTLCNERSSGSHCMIILDLPSVGGRLMLVDMAGSMNIEQAGQTGLDAKIQTGKINKGNIALKRVVESMTNGDSHVPFRDSKLTMLLQDSFEDDKSKILMVLCESQCRKSSIQEVAAAAAGGRIATPSTAASLLKAAQSRAVHIIPAGGAFVRADGQSLPGTNMSPLGGKLSGKGRMVRPIENPLHVPPRTGSGRPGIASPSTQLETKTGAQILKMQETAAAKIDRMTSEMDVGELLKMDYGGTDGMGLRCPTSYGGQKGQSLYRGTDSSYAANVAVTSQGTLGRKASILNSGSTTENCCKKRGTGDIPGKPSRPWGPDARVSVQKSPTQTGPSDETGSSSKKKKNKWTEEDMELKATVQKCGEGNWAGILKQDFKHNRTASQLSQRWSTIRKNEPDLKPGGSKRSHSDECVATNKAATLALDMPMLRSASAIFPGATQSNTQACSTLFSASKPSLPPNQSREPSRAVHIIPAEGTFVGADGRTVHFIPAVNADGEAIRIIPEYLLKTDYGRPDWMGLRRPTNYGGQKGQSLYRGTSNSYAANVAVTSRGTEEMNLKVDERTEMMRLQLWTPEETMLQQKEELASPRKRLEEIKCDWDRCEIDRDGSLNSRLSDVQDDVGAVLLKLPGKVSLRTLSEEDAEGDIRVSTDSDKVYIREIDWDLCNIRGHKRRKAQRQMRWKAQMKMRWKAHMKMRRKAQIQMRWKAQKAQIQMRWKAQKAQMKMRWKAQKAEKVQMKDSDEVDIREIDWDQGEFTDEDEVDIREIDQDQCELTDSDEVDIREIDRDPCEIDKDGSLNSHLSDVQDDVGAVLLKVPGKVSLRSLFKENAEGDIRESTDSDEVYIREIDWDQCELTDSDEVDIREIDRNRCELDWDWDYLNSHLSDVEDDVGAVLLEDGEGDIRESTEEDGEGDIRERRVEGPLWSSNLKGERSDGPCKQATKLQQSAEGTSSLFASDQEAASRSCSF